MKGNGALGQVLKLCNSYYCSYLVGIIRYANESMDAPDCNKGLNDCVVVPNLRVAPEM